MHTARPIPGWTPSTPPVVGERGPDSLDDHATIAIHFWAPWNAVDPKFDEQIRQVAERSSARVQFYSCNVDLAESRDLCEQCQIVNVPALSVRAAGTWQRPIIGCPPSADELACEIESRLSGQVPLGPPQDDAQVWRQMIAVWLLGAGILIAVVAALLTFTR